MSTIFIAAGPDVKKREIEEVRNIDVAPIILELLGVQGSDMRTGAPSFMAKRIAALSPSSRLGSGSGSPAWGLSHD
jgi:hypothetical protein